MAAAEVVSSGTKKDKDNNGGWPSDALWIGRVRYLGREGEALWNDEEMHLGC